MADCPLSYRTQSHAYLHWQRVHVLSVVETKDRPPGPLSRRTIGPRASLVRLKSTMFLNLSPTASSPGSLCPNHAPDVSFALRSASQGFPISGMSFRRHSIRERSETSPQPLSQRAASGQRGLVLGSPLMAAEVSTRQSAYPSTAAQIPN